MNRRMLSMGFIFQQKEYNALVRTIEIFPSITFRVTIMNGELERQFFNYNTFRFVNEEVIAVNKPADGQLQKLQMIIATSLQEHLNKSKALLGTGLQIALS